MLCSYHNKNYPIPSPRKKKNQTKDIRKLSEVMDLFIAWIVMLTS